MSDPVLGAGKTMEKHCHMDLTFQLEKDKPINDIFLASNSYMKKSKADYS